MKNILIILISITIAAITSSSVLEAHQFKVGSKIVRVRATYVNVVTVKRIGRCPMQYRMFKKSRQCYFYNKIVNPFLKSAKKLRSEPVDIVDGKHISLKNYKYLAKNYKQILQKANFSPGAFFYSQLNNNLMVIVDVDFKKIPIKKGRGSEVPIPVIRPQGWDSLTSITTWLNLNTLKLETGIGLAVQYLGTTSFKGTVKAIEGLWIVKTTTGKSFGWIIFKGNRIWATGILTGKKTPEIGKYEIQGSNIIFRNIEYWVPTESHSFKGKWVLESNREITVDRILNKRSFKSGSFIFEAYRP